MSSRVWQARWCSCSCPNTIQHMPRQQHMQRLCLSDLNRRKPNPTKFICFSTTSSPGGPIDESESKSVLDAFFLGKALAEAVNERIESAVGEFLSTVGRLQAEQQKQVQDFQDEVLERAKKAKEIAAREAMEAQGVMRKPSTDTVSASGGDVDFMTIMTPVVSTNSSYPNTSGVDANPGRNEEDSISDVPIDD